MSYKRHTTARSERRTFVGGLLIERRRAPEPLIGSGKKIAALTGELRVVDSH